MRTVKLSAFLSGLCGVAVALGLLATNARATITTERGASILAFPKVRYDTGSVDTIIQITNISNSMVHARCFYVNAAPDQFGDPRWQVTDFNIWLTKQQPTHWQVSSGRFVDPTDSCFANNTIDPTKCANAGIDPGLVPPVPAGFEGELKCVEVDISDSPIGGNHLKGEATIKVGTDVVKYNAVGFVGTERVGETGNELRLDQPLGEEDPVGQYDACPAALLLNHFAEGVTDPVILDNGFGGTCTSTPFPCQTDDECDALGAGTCKDPPQVLDAAGDLALRSATLTDLTLVPCQQDFENNIPGRVTVQFQIYNEFEQVFSASTTIDCWRNLFLFEVDSPNDPDRSVFGAFLGTPTAHTRIIPNNDGGGVIGVAGVLRADNVPRVTRAALNIHFEGDRLSESFGEVVDIITLSEGF